MGVPVERDSSQRHFSWLGPSLPWLLLIRGTVTDTVDMDGEATTGLMATMATMERGLQMPSLSPQLLLSPMLMLIRGTAMATVDMDGVATTGLMDTMATTERDPQKLSQSLLLLLILTLMLMPGTDTTATDTVDMDGVATTGPMDMGVTGEVTGVKQTNREVDSSSDCDFCRH